MKQQRGFGMIAAVVILVILSSLAAAIVSFSSGQQIASAQDLMASKAWQAAKAGNEWGLFFALHKPTPMIWPESAATCDTAISPAPEVSQKLDLRLETGFYVKVSCRSSILYNEGETTPGLANTVRIYTITAVACNVNGCPAVDASSPTYVERTRVVMASN
jgi:MSHA biogenesis protein MshP